MKTKKKKWIALCLCLVLLSGFAIFLFTSVSCRITPKGVGKCISISFFDKQKLKNVDKVVLVKDFGETKKVATITDEEFIRQILEETAVATHANFGCTKGDMWRIDLYDGDKLVRSMHVSQCYGLHVNVYDSDATHWLIAPEFRFTDNKGWVQLSDELYNKLMAALYAQ